jgi:hypothetical protein
MKVLVLLLFVVVSVTAQVEHAPTVAQCQADQRFWLASLEGDTTNLPDYQVLRQWDNEMTVCEKVDPDKKWLYYNTSGEIDGVMITRLVDFLGRHNMWGQFKEEDAAGKR